MRFHQKLPFNPGCERFSLSFFKHRWSKLGLIKYNMTLGERSTVRSYRFQGGVWETMPELGDSVFTSCVHLFTIKFVKGAFDRLAKFDIKFFQCYKSKSYSLGIK